ncbi:MAG TPA: DoxX family protein [Burkholderiaceae bacterium]|jgi:putative oxidoreductase|nr:DoxX family protein [Burkholderiaceae bacterium]
MNQNMQNSTALAGRILLALIFVLSGFNKITGFDGTAAYMASAGLPFTKVLLVLTIAVELGGGLLIMLGWKARWVALVVFLFLIPVTLVFHNPAADPAQAQQQMVHLLKNVAIMGGMLHLFAFGAGAWSVDGRRSVQA